MIWVILEEVDNGEYGYGGEWISSTTATVYSAFSNEEDARKCFEELEKVSGTYTLEETILY